LVDVTPDDLAKLGLPLRFAKELTLAASGGPATEPPGSKGAAGKGKGGKGFGGSPSEDSKGKGKGKGKDKGKDFLKGAKDKGKDGKGKGKDKGKGPGGKGKFSDVISLEEAADMDPEFNICQRVLGAGGRNVRHIYEITGASAWLKGVGSDDSVNSSEPLHVSLSCSSQEGLDKALEMANDLISTVFDEYSQWAEKQEAGPGGKGKGKSFKGGFKGFKGKGKSKGKDKGKDKGKGKDKDKGKGKG
ncbi:unnamed protein product, partial [Polarella glacialis]